MTIDVSIWERFSEHLQNPSHRKQRVAHPNQFLVNWQFNTTQNSTGQMECLFGITGKDFVLLAADTLSARSIVVMKDDQDKIKNLNDYSAMAFSGEPGDTIAFADYAQRNTQLFSIQTERHLQPEECAFFVRKLLANSLRTRDAYSVNVLIGGYNEQVATPKLYWIDYTAAMVEVPFGVQGYGAYFCLSLLDRHYKPQMELSEALVLLRMCFDELKTRFIVNVTSYTIKLISSTGIKEIDLAGRPKSSMEGDVETSAMHL